MRKILFRGKRLDNGEWVTGYVLFSKDNSEAVIAKLTDTESVCENVDPATVGQFTGLHDKNGKEIYEGDVVRTLSGFVGYMRYNERFIRFEVAAPYESYDNERNPDGVPRESWEVIGNIHDNPELLNQ